LFEFGLGEKLVDGSDFVNLFNNSKHIYYGAIKLTPTATKRRKVREIHISSCLLVTGSKLLGNKVD
jgi:hypothetical protein